jgi:hypothetical protein
VADGTDALLQRIASCSVREVDQTLAELQTMSNFLEDEGARIQREIVERAHLSHKKRSDLDATNQCAKVRNDIAWAWH